MRALAVLAVLACGACGDDRVLREPRADVPVRARVLTDEQWSNAVQDLLGIAAQVHTPGSLPHQLIHDDVTAIDPATLVEYRIAAEQVAQRVPAICADAGCALDLAARAFRRPLEADERNALQTLFERGGSSLVVEAILQAPSFLYRGEVHALLTPYELAAELSFLLYDSLPDEQLRAAAADGSLGDREVLAREVDRLLGEPRVQAHLVDVVMDWFEVARVLDAQKDAQLYPELTDELRETMYADTQAFVRAALAHGDKSLGELARGILTQRSVLTMLGTNTRGSIIQRGIYIHRNLLCTPELGRPPFQTIADLAGFTGKLSESQFAHYRAANLYCSTCHRIIDPPGRALERFDALGRWRDVDEIGVPVEDDATLEIDGKQVDVRGAVQLGRALAASEQLKRCAVERLAEHAYGRQLDAANLSYLEDRFDGDVVGLVRTIATSPSFWRRHRE